MNNESNKESNKNTNYIIIILISLLTILVGIFIIGFLLRKKPIEPDYPRNTDNPHYDESDFYYAPYFKSDDPKFIDVPQVNEDFIYIGSKEDKIESNNTIFKSIDEIESKFDLNVSEYQSKLDFNNYNYIAISVSNRSFSSSELQITKNSSYPSDYKIINDNINIKITNALYCFGEEDDEYTYYLLGIDKSLTSINVKIENKYINGQSDCVRFVELYKPIIYIYPEKKTDVSIKLLNDKSLSVTYPKYNGKWKVTAYPNGDLYDKDGKYYYGLYWEGIKQNKSIQKDGFVIKGKDTIDFLEEKLSILGLNDRERNEFIIYWLPKMENNKYNYIRFETKEEIDNYMPLDITPYPDTLIRIVMDFKPLNDIINVNEQKLQKVSRKGYTVVEWGGSQLN